MNLISLILLFIFILPSVSLAEQIDPIIPLPELSEEFPLPELLEALTLYKNKKYSEAIKKLSDYKTEKGVSDQYYYLYAESLSGEKEYLDSLEYFRNAYIYSEEGELKELSLFKRAEIYNKLKFFHEANGILNNFLKQYPESKYTNRAHLAIAESLIGMGFLKKSLEHYNVAGEISEALFGKANVLQRLGRLEDAYMLYKMAIRLDKDYFMKSNETQYYYAQNLLLKDKPSEAKKHLSFLMDTTFKQMAQISMGIIEMNENNLDKAIDLFENALISKDKSIKRNALFNLAKVHMKAGYNDKAKAVLNKLKDEYFSGKDYDKVILLLSKIYRNEGNYDKSISLLREQILSHKKEALNELEAILLDVKDKDMPMFLSLWKLYGVWLLDKSREKFLFKMADVLKNSVEQYFNLNMWLLNKGSKEASLKSLEVLAEFYAELGIINTASIYIERLKNLTGYSDTIHRLEAKNYYEKKQYHSTIKSLMALKKFEEKDIDLYIDAMFSREDIKSAIKFYREKVEGVKKNSKTYNYIADILYGIDRTKEALYFYSLAVEIEPENEWALYRIGILSDNKRFKEIPDKGSMINNFTKEILRGQELNKKLSEVL